MIMKNDGIVSLTPLEFTRQKPGVYAGDTTYSTQLVMEILSNAIDEYRIGNGNEIVVSLSTDEDDKYWCCVKDNGSGFPINDLRDDGETTFQAAFDVLNTSGKYTEDGRYQGNSLGAYGIGCKLTNFLSHELIAVTIRDGKLETNIYEEGVFKKRRLDNSRQPNGTTVIWNPSEEFFENVQVDYDKFYKDINTIVCLCPGLKIIVKTEGKERIFYSETGLEQLVNQKIESSKVKEVMKDRCSIHTSAIDMVMTYTTAYSSEIIAYANVGYTESGPHITQIKSTITREMKKFFEENKWIDQDVKLTGENIQEGMLLIFNVNVPNISYDAQVKSRITKLDTSVFLEDVKSGLRKWLTSNKKDVKALVDKAVAAKKANEAAKRARERIRNAGNAKGLKAKLQVSDKFIDCVNRKPSERNLLLVEGQSAGSSAVEARNVKTDAIYALRGKVLNVLKSKPEKVLENQELFDIIMKIGAGYLDTFDIKKMMFDKVIIVSDADSDGAAIELLCTVFFFTYMRPLVEAGKLYRAVTPLYVIRGKTAAQDKYFYSEKEFQQYDLKKGEHVRHVKGLGEIDAKTLKDVCFEHQRYRRITVSDAQKAEQLLTVLEGPEIAPRKQFVFDNAKELGFNY